MSLAMHFVPLSPKSFDDLSHANECDGLAIIGDDELQNDKFGVEQFNDIVHYLITGKPCPLLRLSFCLPTAKESLNAFVPKDSVSDPLSYAIGGGWVLPKPLSSVAYYLEPERVQKAAAVIQKISVTDLLSKWDFEMMKTLELNYLARLHVTDLNWLWPPFQADYAKAAERNNFIIKYFA
jgi:hypothetical protein